MADRANIPPTSGIAKKKTYCDCTGTYNRSFLYRFLSWRVKVATICVYCKIMLGLHFVRCFRTLNECFTGENTPPLPCYVLIQLYI